VQSAPSALRLAATALAKRPALTATARSLSIDRVAAEVTAALEASGVDCMLVKGAAVARALYADGGRRTYVDCDLLVRERDVPTADAVLASLGFQHPNDEDAGVLAEMLHSHTWMRPRDGAYVDLHWTFAAIPAPPERVFEALFAHARVARVGGGEMRLADPASTALLPALQLVQHGSVDGIKFAADVERARDARRRHVERSRRDSVARA
jgi:hypothetical protein